jgi:hypothetical protein
VTVAFPPIPRGAIVSPRMVRMSGDLVSTLGGPTQRITRVGSRYAAEVELPTLDAACAGRWLGAVLSAEAHGDTLALVMPQMLDVSTVGAVTGTGAAGAAQITYTGLGLAAGMWFSFTANGRNYLHMVTAVLTTTTASIAPQLRTPMAATVMEIQKPKLEGYCDDAAWSLEWFKFVGHSFTITESA